MLSIGGVPVAACGLERRCFAAPRLVKVDRSLAGSQAAQLAGELNSLRRLGEHHFTQIPPLRVAHPCGCPSDPHTRGWRIGELLRHCCILGRRRSNRQRTVRPGAG